jgi:hypothetical protein
MRGRTGDELLRFPVLLRGIVLGQPVDLLLHPTAPRALGLDVRCGDQTHRFLPFAATSLRAEGFGVDSALVLVDLKPDSAYRTQARPLSSLRGSRLGDDREQLRDVVLGPDWAIEELVIGCGGETRRVPLDGFVLPVRNPTRVARLQPAPRRRIR